MSKEKQIEEMARDICEHYNSDGTCYHDGKPCDFKCEGFTDAQYLYEKGYRKASDVAEEIFAEIEEYMLPALIGNKFPAKVINPDKFAELKKKYTEGEE